MLYESAPRKPPQTGVRRYQWCCPWTNGGIHDLHDSGASAAFTRVQMDRLAFRGVEHRHRNLVPMAIAAGSMDPNLYGDRVYPTCLRSHCNLLD